MELNGQQITSKSLVMDTKGNLVRVLSVKERPFTGIVVMIQRDGQNPTFCSPEDLEVLSI